MQWLKRSIYDIFFWVSTDDESVAVSLAAGISDVTGMLKSKGPLARVVMCRVIGHITWRTLVCSRVVMRVHCQCCRMIRIACLRHVKKLFLSRNLNISSKRLLIKPVIRHTIIIKFYDTFIYLYEARNVHATHARLFTIILVFKYIFVHHFI